MGQGHVAGGERILLELLAETPPGEVVVCAPAGSDLAGQVSALGHGVADFSLPKLRHSPGPAYVAAYLRAVLAVRRTVRREHAEVVHAFLAFSMKVVAPVALATRTPALASVHEVTTARTIGPARARAQRLMATRFRRVTAVSRYVADALVASGYPPERVVVIHNGVARRSPPRPRAEARQALGLAPDALTYVLVGRLFHLKGHHVAIEALARLVGPGAGSGSAITDARLVIVGGPVEPGDEHYHQELRSLAGRLGVDGIVDFMGQRPDVEAFYDAADVVLVPSVEPDAFPTVVLEAGLAGRPVVVTDMGGGCEAVVHGRTGLVAPPEPGAFAGAMAQMADPDARHAMGAAAASHIATHFSRARFAAHMHEQWELVAGAQPVPG